MSSSRFRLPDRVILTLANGDTLTVKRHLTARDHRQLLRASMRRVVQRDGTEKDEADPLMAPIAQAVAYLLDWSLLDPDGRSVPIQGISDEALTDMLLMLPPEDCNEIAKAIDVHDDAMRAERAAEKNGAGETRLPATSPSPASLAGGTNG